MDGFSDIDSGSEVGSEISEVESTDSDFGDGDGVNDFDETYEDMNSGDETMDYSEDTPEDQDVSENDTENTDATVDEQLDDFDDTSELEGNQEAADISESNKQTPSDFTTDENVDDVLSDFDDDAESIEDGTMEETEENSEDTEAVETANESNEVADETTENTNEAVDNETEAYEESSEEVETEDESGEMADETAESTDEDFDAAEANDESSEEVETEDESGEMTDEIDETPDEDADAVSETNDESSETVETEDESEETAESADETEDNNDETAESTSETENTEENQTDSSTGDSAEKNAADWRNEQSELTPHQRIAEYMNEHNYGREDFATYSQDPVWQELHSAAFPDYDLSAVTNTNEINADVNPISGGRFENVSYQQGQNDIGAQGTCGPTSIANSLNRVTESSAYSENGVLHNAMENNLCNKSDNPYACGGTTTGDVVKIIDNVKDPESNIHTEVYEYGNALSVNDLALRLDDPHTVAMVGVDSATLWDQRGDVACSGLFQHTEAPSDHWITVDSPIRSESGEVTGFNIIDSGGGVSEVSRDRFESMYMGDAGHTVSDPTAIIISNEGEATNIYQTSEGAERVSSYKGSAMESDGGDPPIEIEGVKIYNTEKTLSGVELSGEQKEVNQYFRGDQFSKEDSFEGSLENEHKEQLVKTNCGTTCELNENLNGSLDSNPKYSVKMSEAQINDLNELKELRDNVPEVKEDTVMQKVISP
ncbi:hypothetical protein HMPREF9630_00830 [Peptoanaerobacter stomatis]|uniref:Uncharacterized protein n=2 Tax=Peptoanaerobacter stomatis TaxID=796937 RepID=V9HJG4_9FIRM|nr:hypothetical protein HMPREF9630_00830 [Peptoanaerobacter stomatis]